MSKSRFRINEIDGKLMRSLFSEKHLEILYKICTPEKTICTFDPNKDYYAMGRRSVYYDIVRKLNDNQERDEANE